MKRCLSFASSAAALVGTLIFANTSQASGAPVECAVRCGSPGVATECVLRVPSSKGTAIQEAVRKGAVKRISFCPDAMLVDLGHAVILEGLVRSGTGVKRFVVGAPNKPFKELASAVFASSSCLGLDKACIESRDQARVGAIGGKGIGTLSNPRVGQPCSIGLPCGLVLLPDSPLRFPVSLDGAGVLRVTARLAGSVTSAWPWRDGWVTADASTLKPGLEYIYELADDGGRTLAAGTFTVVSTNMQADVQGDLNKLGAEPSEFDVLEILLDNNLVWDASRPR